MGKAGVMNCTQHEVSHILGKTRAVSVRHDDGSLLCLVFSSAYNGRLTIIYPGEADFECALVSCKEIVISQNEAAFLALGWRDDWLERLENLALPIGQLGKFLLELNGVPK